MSTSKGYLFIVSFLKLFLIYCLGLIIFLISRICFLVGYGNYSELSQNSWDVFLGFFMGFRTDTMSICYGLLPLFLLILGVYFVPMAWLSRYKVFLRKFLIIYSTILFGIFLAILIGDFFFFRFFNDHLNILVFALIDDDTKAVLTSMWTDYPVLRIALFMIVSLLGLNFALKKIVMWEFPLFEVKMLRSLGAVVLSLIIVFTGMRNSWGTFPLRIQNTIVSENTFINKIGVAGVYSLQNAFREKGAETINTDIKQTLKKYKFPSVEVALNAYLDRTDLTNNEFPASLKGVTKFQENLERNKPHVVVIQMESMSNRLLDFHSSDLNLLGDLESELPKAYVFRNFVSASWTTVHSLEALIIGSPETPVSQSTYRKHKLSSSSALPFVNAGYHTSFVTGAELAWRNLGAYLENCYFKDIEGNITLKKNNPKATESDWGTHDEFLFERVFQKLEQANGTPQFIYAMTTTNHTPYDIPKTYKPYSLTMPAYMDTILNTEKTIAMNNFLSYQYANDCLGKFVKRINASSLKDNTIIVAVGDHSILTLFKTPDSQLHQKFSIPFILFVPDAYKPKYEVDQSRFGSHKDVFPTVFNISLSKAEYIKSGNNLMAPPSDSTYYFGVYRYRTGFSKDGCVLVDDKLYFNWLDASYTSLIPSPESDKTKYLQLKTRAYSATMSSFIKNELKQVE